MYPEVCYRGFVSATPLIACIGRCPSNALRPSVQHTLSCGHIGFERFAGDEMPCAASRAIESKRVVSRKKPVGVRLHGRGQHFEDFLLAAAAEPSVLPLFNRCKCLMVRQAHEGFVVCLSKPIQIAVRVGGEQKVSIISGVEVAGQALLTLFVVAVYDLERIAGFKGNGTPVNRRPTADDVRVE